MNYELVWIDPKGDSHVLVSAKLHRQVVPQLCLKVADLAVYIPGLAIVVEGHQVTQLTFVTGSCSLQGVPVYRYEGHDS